MSNKEEVLPPLSESQQREVERVLARLKPALEQASSSILLNTANRGGQKERVAASRNRLKDLENKMKDNPSIRPLAERERQILAKRERDLSGALTDEDLPRLINAAKDALNGEGSSLLAVIGVLNNTGWRGKAMEELRITNADATVNRLHHAVQAALTGIADRDVHVGEWSPKDKRRLVLIDLLNEQYGIRL